MLKQGPKWYSMEFCLFFELLANPTHNTERPLVKYWKGSLKLNIKHGQLAGYYAELWTALTDKTADKPKQPTKS